MLQPGSPMEFISFPAIHLEQLKAYAKASGDFNPIHLDENVAKKVGLPGVIAHGMLIAGLIAERAMKVVREDEKFKNFEMVQFQTRFKAMTLLGDTPSIGGQVREANAEELTLELQAKNQRGETTTTGIAKFKKK